MNVEHIAKGYLGARVDGVLYLLGRVTTGAAYTPEPNDLYLPDVGGGVMAPEELRDAIINKTFVGRLVPYHMLQGPMRVMDEEVFA